MTIPHLKHAFDFTAWGPAEFPYIATDHSNVCVAHAFDGYVSLPDGEKVFKIVTGSDWQTRGPTDVMGIDARVSAVSEDGTENLDLQYYGKIKITKQIEDVIAARGQDGTATEWGDGYYWVTPRVHSRSEKWAWVNDAVFLACGKLALSRDKDGSSISTVSYRVYKVE